MATSWDDLRDDFPGLAGKAYLNAAATSLSPDPGCCTRYGTIASILPSRSEVFGTPRVRSTSTATSS